MENASKALLMAGGVLLGVLILTLIVTLLTGSKSLFNHYEETKQMEAIQQFNVNFTKYLGQDLTIHEVVTICNFAKENGINAISNEKNKDDIKNDHNTYSLTIGYSNEGYVNSIAFKKNNSK